MLLEICRTNSELAQPSKKVWSLIIWSSFKYKIMQMHGNQSTEFLRGHVQQENMVSKPIIIEVTRMETANGKQRKICINLKLKCVCMCACVCDQWMNQSTHCLLRMKPVFSNLPCLFCFDLYFLQKRPSSTTAAVILIHQMVLGLGLESQSQPSIIHHLSVLTND